MVAKTVLVVDADADTRLIYATFLQYAGFEVVEARDGAEALELIPQRRPAVVVTALALPVVSGFEILERLRRDPVTAALPVLIVTTDIHPETRRRAEQAGCDAFFLKPCLPRDLLRAVRDVTERKARRRLLFAEASAHPREGSSALPRVCSIWRPIPGRRVY